METKLGRDAGTAPIGLGITAAAGLPSDLRYNHAPDIVQSRDFTITAKGVCNVCVCARVVSVVRVCMFVSLPLSLCTRVQTYSSTCAAGFNNTRFPAHSGHHVEGYLKPGMHSQKAPTVIRRTWMMQTAQAQVQTLPIVLSRACPLPFAFAYSTSAKLPAFGDQRTDSNPIP